MLDDDAATPLPKSSAVTFTKAGTYAYYCIVHGAEMKGTVINVRKGPAKFHSPLQAGGTWSTKQLKKAGKYSLYCSQHPEEMTMTLKVVKKH